MNARMRSTDAAREAVSKCRAWDHGAMGGACLSTVGGYLAWCADSRRFMAAYSAGFAILITLGLGALFFVLTHHLVRAEWSRNACVRMERIAKLLYLGPLLFVPILLQASQLYPGLTPPLVSGARQSTQALYASVPLFCLRSIVYLAVWSWLASFFRIGELERGLRAAQAATLRRYSGPAMLGLGLTTMFAAFDWWMELQPHFHSSIYGIYIFAGAIGAAIALLVITDAAIAPKVAESEATRDELHDLGKWLFGVVAFWAYIAFSQYLLIWYARLPNELQFYATRWAGTWRPITVALILSRFVLPGLVLLSREAKRSRFDLTAVAAVVLIGHAIDLVWLLLPALSPEGPRFGLAEVAVIGLVVSTTVFTIRSTPLPALALLPAGDPRVPSVSPGASEAPEFPNLSGLDGAAVRWSGRLAPLESIDAARVSTNGVTVSARAIVLAVGCVAVGGGFATTSGFEQRLRRFAEQRRAEAVSATRSDELAAAATQLGECRWINRKAGWIRIPLERAKALVLAQYGGGSPEREPTRISPAPLPGRLSSGGELAVGSMPRDVAGKEQEGTP